MNFSALLRPLLLCATLCTTVIPCQTYAQSGSTGKFSFTWGEEYELPRKHEDLGFIGNATDGYIQIGHRDGSSLTFQKFDDKLHLTAETETDLGNMPRSYNSELITQLGNKHYWFFSTWDRGEDKESLYAQEIDLKTASLKGSASEIASSSKLVSANGWAGMGFWGMGMASAGQEGSSKWNFYYSFDNSKVLVEYRKKPEVRNDAKSNDVIGFQVFDTDMKKLWGREIRMPYTEEMMDNEDYSVDSRGNIYMLAKVYDEKRSRDRKKPNYHFEVLKWSADKQEVTKIPFKFTDKFVSSAYVTEDAAGNIVVGGYYSNRRNSGSTDGVFLLKLDPSTNEMNNIMKGTYAFPLQVMKQYESARTKRRMERKEEKGDVEDQNLVLRDIIMKADGSIQIFGEESYTVTTTYSSGRGGTSTRTVWHNNDIMAMTIGADGEIKWVKKIPKSQQGARGKGGMSFKSFVYKGDTYFFFMDNIKNLDIQKDETPATHQDGAGGILMAVKIDDAGTVTKAKVFDVREDRLNLTVSKFRQVDNNQLMVRGVHKRRDSQAALITFQ